MSPDLDRVLGKLLERSDSANSRLELVEKKLDMLFAFKWQIVGMSALASFLVSAMVEVVLIKLGK